MSMLFSEDCLFVHLVFFMVWLRFMVVVVFGFLGALRERERGGKRAKQVIDMASVLKNQ